MRKGTLRMKKKIISMIALALAALLLSAGIVLFSFKSNVYVTETGDLQIPYRVHSAKKPGQPLLVFFHGGGSTGSDNLRPLWEYLNGPYPELFPLGKRMQLFRKDFTVLIPQSPKGNYSLSDYVTAVKELSEAVAAQAQADVSRIYCMGFSWGGYCTWLSADLFPDYYACAMPIMGGLWDPELPDPLTPEALLHMKDIPVWVSHSADDPIVSVDRDDEVVALLQELDAPVKYTRVDGKGHKHLVSYFFKTEEWADWMFSQSNSK